MTERKPPHVGFESWFDAQIREATERGEFENLSGAGRPLPGAGGDDDEQWWLHSFLRRQEVETEALLPAPLRLRKEIEQLPATVRDLPTEQAVRAVVDALNTRVRDSWRLPSGPAMPVRLVNADRVVAQWREDRSAAATAVPTSPADAAPPAPQGAAADTVPSTSAPPGRASWWRRSTRRRNL